MKMWQTVAQELAETKVLSFNLPFLCVCVCVPYTLPFDVHKL